MLYYFVGIVLQSLYKLILYFIIYGYTCNQKTQFALPAVTTLGVWQLVHLGARRTVTNCLRRG